MIGTTGLMRLSVVLLHTHVLEEARRDSGPPPVRTIGRFLMSRPAAWVHVVLITSLALVTSSASRAFAKAAGPPPGSEVRGAVRAYMEAIDAGDFEGQMRFWSRDPAATSVIMGEIWTGAANIRARSAEYVPVSKRVRNDLGQITVVPLGAGAVLTVTPYRPVRRDPRDEKLKPFELDCMLTLIWTRAPDGWRILHEHVSVKVPPPSAK